MAGMIEARPLAEALASIPFFAGLDHASLEHVGRGMRVRRFRRGEVIFHLGDPGDALFIVTSGAIKIMLPSDTGDEAILATLRAGDVFGELALLDGAPRSATAAALEPTETLVLPRQRFRELLDTQPAVRDALLASLAAELRRLTFLRADFIGVEVADAGQEPLIQQQRLQASASALQQLIELV